MIPVSNKTRSITRVRYKHASFQGQENTINNSYIGHAAVSASFNTVVCRASLSDVDVKTKWIVEPSRGETIETKPAVILHQYPRRHHRPHHLHRLYRRRLRYLCPIAARQ